MAGIRHLMRSSLSEGRFALVCGSTAASALNFYAFVLFPSFFGAQQLEAFVRDNYLGGLYLFSIASSAAPFTVFVLSRAGRAGLSRYAVMSLIALAVIPLLGWQLTRAPWSYLCLVAAVCLHGAGILLAAILYEKRAGIAAALQTVQPLIFALLVSQARLEHGLHEPWAVFYLLSAAGGLIAFVLASDFANIRAILVRIGTSSENWSSAAMLVLLNVSFPLFFQLEQILCGEFSPVHVGHYVIVQKLYSSVATSLFGSLGVLLLAQKMRQENSRIIDGTVALLALASGGAILGVGAIVLFTGRYGALSLSLLLECALVGMLFALASFANLLLAVRTPKISLLALLLSMAIYLPAYFIVQPQSADAVLALAGLLFCVYLLTLFVSGRLMGSPRATAG